MWFINVSLELFKSFDSRRERKEEKGGKEKGIERINNDKNKILISEIQFSERNHIYVFFLYFLYE